MTIYEFHKKLKEDSAVQSYLEFLKDTTGRGYLNAYFEDGGKHYPSYPLPEFKYHNVKGFLKPIYWGGDYKGNMIKHLFGTAEIFDGYTIFGEYTGSISMGSYGSGQGFIRPYMKSKDNDSHDMWKYVVSIRTASKLLDGKNWAPMNFESTMSFYHYLALSSSGVRKIQKESAQILGQKLREIQLAIEEDDAYREWRDGGGTIAKEVAIEFNIKKVYDELKSKVRPGMRLDQETADEIQCSIRDWGRWEHDYEDYDRDESDYEDDDYMILSDKSYEAMDKIIADIREMYPQVTIEWGTSEKNWIDFTITRVANESVEHVVEELVSEKNFQVVTSDAAINYRLSHQSGSGQIIALASSGKDLDKEIESGASKTALGKDIEDTINDQLKKSRESVRVSIDHGYQGAGYAFRLELEDLLKRLNK
jgi:hypothetical protein